MFEALIFAGMILIACVSCVYLGHWLTLKGIGFVQPSAKQMQEAVTGGVTVEPDPWADQKTEGKTEGKTEEETEKDTVTANVNAHKRQEEDFYNVHGDQNFSDLEKIHAGTKTGKEVHKAINPYTPGDNNQ